jgi:hypothetical protein
LFRLWARASTCETFSLNFASVSTRRERPNEAVREGGVEEGREEEEEERGREEGAEEGVDQW